MFRHILGATIVFASACGGGGDKCERATKKLLAMEKAEGKSGSSDAFVEQSIQKCKDGLKRNPESGAMLDCIIAIEGTPSKADLDRCMKAAGKGTLSEYRSKGRATEAVLQLNRLGKNAKVVFVETGAFPKGKVGPSPANECCYGNPGTDTHGKCPVDAAVWKDPIWQALEFEIAEPSVYRYSYESDGKTFTATAVGDADCDMKLVTYTLAGSSEDGNPKVELSEPPKGEY